MKTKVLIIHESFIICSGIESNIRKYFDVEIRIEENAKELLESELLGQYDLIFCGIEFRNTAYVIKQRINCIAVALTSNKKDIPPSLIFDDFLHVNSNEKQIYQVLKKYLNRTDSRGDKEGIILTSREVEVLKCIASGYSNKRIAEELFISTHTVISHRKNITEKTGIKSVSGLTIYAILNKLIDTDFVALQDLP